MSRTRPDEIPAEGLLEFKTKSGGDVTLKKIEFDKEVFLYCQSEGRKKKEEGIKSRFMKGFEEGLKALEFSLRKPRGHNKFDEILQRLGRLKKKYSKVARFYRIEVEKKGEKAVSINWKLEKDEELEARFAGSYYIRTDRKDLSEKELWQLYMMLTQLEDAFRCLKTELGLRPNYHQKDNRMEGHLFITVLAYHLLALIQRELRAKGIHHRLKTIRDLMATQTRVTTSVNNKDGKRIYIRQTLDPEPFHLEIYRALGLLSNPLRTKKMKL